MIGYIMIGTNDLPRAAAFYDKVLIPLGGSRAVSSERMQSYLIEGAGGARLGVCLPYDGKPAAIGNGNMFGLPASSVEVVQAVHALALEAGGTCEGPPGIRPGARTPNFYAAYFRDPDGNKACVFHAKLDG